MPRSCRAESRSPSRTVASSTVSGAYRQSMMAEIPAPTAFRLMWNSVSDVAMAMIPLANRIRMSRDDPCQPAWPARATVGSRRQVETTTRNRLSANGDTVSPDLFRRITASAQISAVSECEELAHVPPIVHHARRDIRSSAGPGPGTSQGRNSFIYIDARDCPRFRPGGCRGHPHFRSSRKRPKADTGEENLAGDPFETGK